MEIRAGLGWGRGMTEIKQAVLLVVRSYWEKGTLARIVLRQRNNIQRRISQLCRQAELNHFLFSDSPK